MITIIDYDMGNLGSIANMFKKIGIPSCITSNAEQVAAAEKILLPGVGTFDTAMARINERGLLDVLNCKALEEKIPILGICLGMQLLTNSSEEGDSVGLGWIPAKTLAFKGRIDTPPYKIPHMGWNIARKHTPSSLTEGFEELDDVRFYFVHSYQVQCEDERNSIMRTTYGLTFDSAIQKENIFGAQFHPEKSHKFGMKLLHNFARL